MIRVQISVQGIVQGVGFRPFVFSLAAKHLIRGRVLNNTLGVLIDVEGEQSLIQQFIDGIKSNSPPLSRSASVHISENLEPVNYSEFRIAESASDGKPLAPISPDIATCEDCLRELFDPNDRRYRYPFINCTNCGPRFTIIEGVPYDREKTTMRDFGMCDSCRDEYVNPLDRRFHAEPIACALCGPRLSLTNSDGSAIAFNTNNEKDLIRHTLLLLLSGSIIIAIKGIGGFHLACDALNAEAVVRLRRRKHREDKPFALMARSRRSEGGAAGNRGDANRLRRHAHRGYARRRAVAQNMLTCDVSVNTARPVKSFFVSSLRQIEVGHSLFI